MSVIAFRGRDPESEARALLNSVLKDGDIIGTAEDGRTALMLVVDPWTLDRLLAFDADTTDLEDNGDLEENDGRPESVYEAVPAKRLRRPARVVQAIALALLLTTAPYAVARADQATVVSTLPMSTAQAPQQCCRVCRKGKACGDGCISTDKQCKKDQGCACSAASGS